MHGGPIQPIARLYFKRERIFPKSCFEESSSESDREGQETEKRRKYNEILPHFQYNKLLLYFL